MNFLPLTRGDLDALKPTYTSSIPSNVHPKSEEIALYVLKYFDEHWQWPSEAARACFIRMGIHTSLPYIVPDMKDELVNIGAVWFTAWHWIDDTLEQCNLDSQVHLRLLPLVTGDTQPEVGNNPEVMMYNLHETGRTTGSELDRKLFAEVQQETLRWFKCVISHRAALQSGAQPGVYKTLEDYLDFRKQEIAIDLMWAYVRWACGTDIIPEILAHPDIRMISYIAGNHCTFVNDLFSLRKELNEIQEKAKLGIKMDCPNSVVFLATKHGVTLIEAIDAMTGKLAAYEQEFLDAEKKAIQTISSLYGEENGELVRKYAHGLKMSMAGNVTWSTQCGRYNDLDIPLPLHHSKTDEEVLGGH